MMRASLFLIATLLSLFAAAAPSGDLPTTAQVVDRAIATPAPAGAPAPDGAAEAAAVIQSLLA